MDLIEAYLACSDDRVAEWYEEALRRSGKWQNKLREKRQSRMGSSKPSTSYQTAKPSSDMARLGAVLVSPTLKGASVDTTLSSRLSVQDAAQILCSSKGLKSGAKLEPLAKWSTVKRRPWLHSDLDADGGITFCTGAGYVRFPPAMVDELGIPFCAAEACVIEATEEHIAIGDKA